ncbi:transposase [Collimonas sp.]|jgi:transposase|uniref:transposase n=1 Tax=Collimonas sp. TaxID=1963772 RepID=UPI002C4DF267|nr:transposase [Collimonas sp.]HWW07573.1 transposase [Collimonas sp.]
MDLREEYWQKLKPLLPGGDADPGASGRDNRLFLQAILWIVKRQSKWSNLPPEFGRWQTSYVRFMRWNQADIWRQLAHHLSDDSELQKLLNPIVAFGDEYTRRAAQRSINKDNRIAYSAMLGRIVPPKAYPLAEENTIANASSNWIWLLTRK